MDKYLIDSIKLIELVKMRPELYGKASSSNSATDVRIRAWNSIAEHLNVDVKSIRSRWKSLRDTFQKCLKKARQSESETVTIKWPYFEKLLFLKDYVGQVGARSFYNGSGKFSNSGENFENDPINYDEDTFMDKDNRENTDYQQSVQKFETEEWSQYDEDTFICSPSYDGEKSEKFLNSSSAMKRKCEINDNSSNKRISLMEESDDLDKQITKCLDIFKGKLERPKDAIDNFCEFISSFMKQWPAEEQCDTIKYLTNYVMEKHMSVVNNGIS